MRAVQVGWGLVLGAAMAVVPVEGDASPPEFGSHWHDGKAELDGYRLTVQRYGQRRSGRAVMIYVTEPFSESRRVKVEDPSRDPADTFDALKLNLVREFPTGIYDYHTVISLFTRSADFSPVKLAYSSAEWCGQVYEQLDFQRTGITSRLHSYFEGESSTRTLERAPRGVVEDELFILLRGLRGAFLEPGETRTVPFLASPFYRRLTHQPIAWTSATLARSRTTERVRVPAGTFEADVIEVRPADGRVGRFHVEQAYPHRIVKWSWTRGAAGSRERLEGTDAGELTGTARLEYWRLQGEGDERYLERLGLSRPTP